VVKNVAFVAPGKLTIPTGGFAYDQRIVQELGLLDWCVEVLELDGDFPFPSAAARAAAGQRLAALPAAMPIVIDGLAFGALPDAAADLGDSRRLIALVHHPLAMETGLSSRDADALRESETRALGRARRVIATSAFTGRILVSDYGVSADRLMIAQPGSDRMARTKFASSDALALLAVGAITHRKGYDVLVAALAMLADLPWRLTIVGDRSRDSDAVARLDADIARFQLSDRVTVAGAVPAQRLADLYAAAHIFVLASRFEGYGMALADALAHGLPVVGTAAGAVAETLPTGAGLLAPPDDVVALSLALRRMIADPDVRRRCADRAWRAAADLPSWRGAAEIFQMAIESAR
jgi:glycosyltransferase involved in cell wall biosynthesis